MHQPISNSLSVLLSLIHHHCSKYGQLTLTGIQTLLTITVNAHFPFFQKFAVITNPQPKVNLLQNFTDISVLCDYVCRLWPMR